MRFVPHREVSFQYSLDAIDPEYDSDYESDSSVDSGSLVVETQSLLINDEKSDTLTMTKFYDVLEDPVIQKTLQVIQEASKTSIVEHNQESSRDLFQKSMLKWYQQFIDSIQTTTTASTKAPPTLDLVDDDTTFEVLGKEVEKLVIQVKQEKQRQAEEAERRRIEAERKLKEEAERARIEAERALLALLALLAQKKLEEEALKLELEQLRKLKEAEEAEKKAQEQLKRELEARAKLELELKLQQLQELGRHSDIKIQKEFLKYKQDIADIKLQIVEPLLANKDLKQLTNKLRRKMNPKFGQLTNSEQKLLEISNEMVSLVEESKKLSELSYKYILNFIAKELIKQAEVEVIVSPSHSIPLAKFATNLLSQFPDLTYFVLARFYKKCPYLIGYTCSIDTEEGRLRMGWRRSSGKWEEESKYNERVGGIATLYAVMSRLDVDPSMTPITMSSSWLFLSRTLNTSADLLQDVHYILVANWWEACAFQFLQVYREQGQKLLQLVCSDWLQLVEGRKFSGYVRLRLLGEEWSQKNSITQFKAMER